MGYMLDFQKMSDFQVQLDSKLPSMFYTEKLSETLTPRQ
jgi:hypothetical protein